MTSWRLRSTVRRVKVVVSAFGALLAVTIALSMSLLTSHASAEQPIIEQHSSVVIDPVHDKPKVSDEEESKETGSRHSKAANANAAERAEHTSSDLTKEKKPSIFRDPKDGWLDASAWLDKAYGFVPIPSLITEPALGGIGGALGLAFLGKRKVDEKIPPNIFVLGGGYTANKSWFAGGGYRGVFDQGRWRVSASGFYAEPNLDLYVQTTKLGELKARAEIRSFGGGGRAMRRLGDFPIYLGASLSDKQIHLDLSGDLFGDAVNVPDLKLDQNQLQVNVSGEIDTRNNFFSPVSGTYIKTEGGYNKISGDQSSHFGTVYVAAHQFFDLNHVVLGFRAISNAALGEVPFYLRPYVSLRGVPLARYQGDWAFALETEEMIRFTPRISMVVFGGWGKALSDDVNFKEATNAWSVGTGFRYLLARLYGLQMGFDIARGPETFAWYIQFGHAWGGD